MTQKAQGGCRGRAIGVQCRVGSLARITLPNLIGGARAKRDVYATH